MNDITFVEAAKALSKASIDQCGPKPDACIKYGFRRVLSRDPTAEELRLLAKLWQESRAELESSPERVSELLSVGETKIEGKYQLDVAAGTLVMQAILVLDEALTRN
jgi:hypothetical protein